MKKVLFLAIIIALMLFSFAYADVPTVTITLPVTGQHPSFSTSVGDSSCYRVSSLVFWDHYNQGSMSADAIFESGRTYTIYITLTPLNGYSLPRGNGTSILVNDTYSAGYYFTDDDDNVMYKFSYTTPNLRITVNGIQVGAKVKDLTIQSSDPNIVIDTYSLQYQNAYGGWRTITGSKQILAGVIYNITIYLAGANESVDLSKYTKYDVFVNDNNPTYFTSETGGKKRIFTRITDGLPAEEYGIETDADAGVEVRLAGSDEIISSARPGQMITFTLNGTGTPEGKVFACWRSNGNLYNVNREDIPLTMEMPERYVMMGATFAYEIEDVSFNESYIEPVVGANIPEVTLTVKSVNGDTSLAEKVNVTSAKWMKYDSEYDAWEEATGTFESDSDYRLQIKLSGTDYNYLFLPNIVNTFKGFDVANSFVERDDSNFQIGIYYSIEWPQKLKGDLDGNGVVNIVDVRLLLQVYINSSNSTVWTERQLATFDMNGDSKIDILDVRIVLQKYINS